MENGHGQKPDESLRALVESERGRGLRIHLVDRARHLEDAGRGLVPDGGACRGRKLPIAHARTALQTYLYAFAKGRPGAVAWIVDDDMRLDPLVADKNGRLQRRSLDLASALRELRKLHASGDIDIAIGAYTGAPPLPFGATVRVQLVDLFGVLAMACGTAPPGGVVRSQRRECGTTVRSARLLLRSVAQGDRPARDAVLGHAGLSRRTCRRGVRTHGRRGGADPGGRAGLPAPRGRDRSPGIDRRRTPARRQYLRARHRGAEAGAQSLAHHRRPTEPALRHAVVAAAATLLRTAGQGSPGRALPRPLPCPGRHAGHRADRGRHAGLRDVFGASRHSRSVQGHEWWGASI